MPVSKSKPNSRMKPLRISLLVEIPHNSLSIGRQFSYTPQLSLKQAKYLHFCWLYLISVLTGTLSLPGIEIQLTLALKWRMYYLTGKCKILGLASGILMVYFPWVDPIWGRCSLMVAFMATNKSQLTSYSCMWLKSREHLLFWMPAKVLIELDCNGCQFLTNPYARMIKCSDQPSHVLCWREGRRKSALFQSKEKRSNHQKKNWRKIIPIW